MPLTRAPPQYENLPGQNYEGGAVWLRPGGVRGGYVPQQPVQQPMQPTMPINGNPTGGGQPDGTPPSQQIPVVQILPPNQGPSVVQHDMRIPPHEDSIGGFIIAALESGAEPIITPNSKVADDHVARERLKAAAKKGPIAAVGDELIKDLEDDEKNFNRGLNVIENEINTLIDLPARVQALETYLVAGVAILAAYYMLD